MNVKRYLLAALGIFVFSFVFEFLWHGLLLKDLYQNTQNLWRPEAEMANFLPFSFAIQIAMALLLTYIFTRHYEGKGLGEGLRFGIYFGLLFGLMGVSWYAYLPIPLKLAVMWGVGGVLFGIGIGIVASLIYRR